MNSKAAEPRQHNNTHFNLLYYACKVVKPAGPQPIPSQGLLGQVDNQSAGRGNCAEFSALGELWNHGLFIQKISNKLMISSCGSLIYAKA